MRKAMAHIEIKIDKKYKKMYGETKYYVFYGGRQLFEFVNRFKGIWYFYDMFRERPFCTITDTNVPIERIKNLAVAHALIANGGESLTDTEIYGDKITVNRNAPEYPSN